jgi:polysaccharide pyruvyl transferase WcaK-like protein
VMEKEILSSVLPIDRWIPSPPLNEVFSQLSQFDGIISARFHGLVLASMLKIPFVGIGDADKVGRLCAATSAPFLAWRSSPASVAGVIGDFCRSVSKSPAKSC